MAHAFFGQARPGFDGPIGSVAQADGHRGLRDLIPTIGFGMLAPEAPLDHVGRVGHYFLGTGTMTGVGALGWARGARAIFGAAALG